jgi:hypothetical protein
MAAAFTARFSSLVSPAEFGIHVDDPIEHLGHCHQLIESSLITVKNAVIGLGLTTPVLRVEAVAALDYELALLQLLANLHSRDEEESLFPRLKNRASVESGFAAELIPLIESQHRAQEAVLGQLAACLYNFPAEGPAAEERLARLTSLAEQLDYLFRVNLALEEEKVIANCRRALTARELEGMRQEMSLRFKSH